MMVIIPVKENGEWRAKMKPDGMPCPHLSYDGTKAACAVHDEPIYEGSPCWVYGNGLVDPDYASTRDRPCRVGEMYQRAGGFQKTRPQLFQVRVGELVKLEDLGPFESNESYVQIAKETAEELKKLDMKGLE